MCYSDQDANFRIASSAVLRKWVNHFIRSGNLQAIKKEINTEVGITF